MAPQIHMPKKPNESQRNVLFLMNGSVLSFALMTNGNRIIEQNDQRRKAKVNGATSDTTPRPKMIFVEKNSGVRAKTIHGQMALLFELFVATSQTFIVD